MHFRPLPPTLLCCLLGPLAVLFMLTACRKSDPAAKTDLNPFSSPEPPTTITGPVWEAESEPFSPTLPHLFDNGRILVMPPEYSNLTETLLPRDQYAFSAMDRYGRLYHFDRGGRWWMSAGEALPAELPEHEWDVAWNPALKAPELLITNSYFGRTDFTLLHLRNGVWEGFTTDTTQTLRNPPARRGAHRLHLPDRQAWLIAGGTLVSTSSLSTTTTGPLLAGAGAARVDAWWREGERWSPWTGFQTPGERGLAPPATSPDPSQIRSLLSGSTDSTINMLLTSGDLWVWQDSQWRWRERLPNQEQLFIADGVPALRELLFVWKIGRGYDQALTRPARLTTGTQSLEPPTPLNQTANVKINEDDEGFWRGWGRLKSETQSDGSTRERFTPGFETPGEDAIHIVSEVGDVYFRRSQLSIIELPPDLGELRPQASAFVPGLGGLVIPSVGGIGLNAEQSSFFPQTHTTDTQTTDPRLMIDVLARSFRFWNFRGDLISWMKSPSDIHPQIGFPQVFYHGEDRRRTLSWTFPEPGLIRFEYHEVSKENEQWVSSPLLTLRTLPQLAWNPTDELVICEPVVWGDPPEIVLIGWCGRITRPRNHRELEEEIGDEVYTEVPTRGFMARISALNPEEWQVSDLPIAFSRGARLVVDHTLGKLYLLGGRVASPRAHENRPYLIMGSNNIVWEWDGKLWRYIKPEGTVPQMKVVSNVAFDPINHQLLSLTPRALYGFQADAWHELWRRGKPDGEDWPNEVGLYVHPADNLKLGIWFKDQSEMHVWNGEHWEPVVRPKDHQQITWPYNSKIEGGGEWPNAADNLLPALVPEAFISIDGEKLAELRMDVPRDRDADRLVRARWVSLKKNDAVRLTAPAPGLLGMHVD